MYAEIPALSNKPLKCITNWHWASNFVLRYSNCYHTDLETGNIPHISGLGSLVLISILSAYFCEHWSKLQPHPRQCKMVHKLSHITHTTAWREEKATHTYTLSSTQILGPTTLAAPLAILKAKCFSGQAFVVPHLYLGGFVALEGKKEKLYSNKSKDIIWDYWYFTTDFKERSQAYVTSSPNERINLTWRWANAGGGERRAGAVSWPCVCLGLSSAWSWISSSFPIAEDLASSIQTVTEMDIGGAAAIILLPLMGTDSPQTGCLNKTFRF